MKVEIQYVDDDSDIQIEEAKFGGILEISGYRLSKPIETSVFGNADEGYRIIHYLPVYPRPDKSQSFSVEGRGKTRDEASRHFGSKLKERLEIFRGMNLDIMDETQKLQLAYLKSIMIPLSKDIK